MEGKRKSQIRYLSPVRSRAEVLIFCATWDIWQCLKSFWVVTTEGRGATSISWAEARDAAKPIMYRTAPHNKESSGTKCQQYWGWHWSRVVWTFWNSRTCSWRSPDFIVGLAKMEKNANRPEPSSSATPFKLWKTGLQILQWKHERSLNETW